MQNQPRISRQGYDINDAQVPPTWACWPGL